jgi:hypothetical protein
MKRRFTPDLTSLRTLDDESEFDVVVVGGGAAGLSAAVFAVTRGARVLVVEKSRLLGGTSSMTAGTLWVPGTSAAIAAGAPADDVEGAGRFLNVAVGDRSSPLLRRIYLESGPAAISYLEANSHVRFAPRAVHPDYMAEVPGAANGLRAIETVEFDGRELGASLSMVRQQSPEFTVFGGMMLAREDIAAFSRIARAPLSPSNLPVILRAGRRIARHVMDTARLPRSTRMTMGNALIGQLLLTLNENGATIALASTVASIERTGDRVTSVSVHQGSIKRKVEVRAALIAATGGFNRNASRRERLIPGVPDAWSAVSPGTTGELHDLLDELGGHYGPVGDSAAFWAPVSLPPRRGGTHGVYTHFAMDRGKPGFIVVDQAGDRYVNESTSYHRFALAMQAHTSAPSMPSFLIGDARAVRKWGIGAVRPGGWGRHRRLRDGYLVTAPTLDALAITLGMEADRLTATVARFNDLARRGLDSDFGRGLSDYERFNGDVSHVPNPALGELASGPYYAIRLFPGDIGSATGFEVDEYCRILDSRGTPIGGAYAIGNDAQSVMGDRYPGPGVTLGPAVVFAHVAVKHALNAGD